MVTHEVDYRGRIAEAVTADEVVEALRAFGLVEVAERLAYLRSLEDDLAEDEEPMDLESLRALGLLLIERPELPKPGIGVSAEGMFQVEWDIVPEGMVVMAFMPGGVINFAAASGSPELGRARPRISGLAACDDALTALAPFMTQLQTR